MKKRVLSMLMTLALCLTLFPAPAWAAEDAPEGGAIVQQEQQEEISPAVSEQAGTNEEENGSEGDPQNTGTPDAGGAEDSKADASEIGEDENAGNNADAAVSAVQTMIDALPTVSELDDMTADELDAAYDDIQAAYDAYEALNAEQQAQITGADFEALLGWFNSQTAPLADAQSGVHTHCVCGKDSSTTVNGHTHSTNTEWKAADSLPGTAGSYYLTQSVTADWTVPTGEVNLCLNGQTISGSITVGSGATLTLTDCSGNGKVQGEVTVNGGKFELYSGTITGGVQVGIKGGTYQTGSSFTMYGGAITGNEDYGGVFLVGTTNHINPPSFTMHGGTISNNTAGASDGGGGGVYVGEKCSFTMDGGTITGNTATAGNGGGIYIHFNAGNVSISNATITGNKASATGNTSYGHGGGIYSERGVTVKNVTITGNNSTYEGGGIYGKGAITLTNATVTDNNHYDVYYGGTESTNPKLTVSGSVKAGYYANYDWKLPILVSGALSKDSVIHVGVREGIEHGAIAEPASGVTLRAENFKADAADSETSLGKDGKVYLVPCTHEMDDTGYTCKKCKTQFDARVGDSAYYKTLTEAFNAARGSTVTLLRDVTLTGNCSAAYDSPATLDLNGKTVSSGRYYIHVGGGNKPNTLTVKDSGTGGGTQALNVKFWVASNGTLAVDNSYTGKISRVELQASGALERFGGEIGELVLSNAAAGSTSTGYNLKLWNGNTNACTIGKITDSTKSKDLTVQDLLKTNHAKCELYGEKDGTWSIVDKSAKIVDLTGYTAYKVQFPECVHQCADDSNPVCSVCHKNLYTKITAKAADGTTKTAYFTEDSALENGYVEAIQTLNGWSNEGCTEPTLTLLRDMPYGTSITLTGTLTLESGTHTAKNVTVAEGADVTFASGSYRGATINGTATVETGVTFTDASVTVNGTLNAKGGTFNGSVKFNGSSTANISGGSFNCEKKYGGVTFDYNVTGTISGGMFAFADFYTTKVKLSGGTFTTIITNGDRKLADLLAEGAAYYNGDSAVSEDKVSSLANVTVKSHEHNGGTDGNGTCSICGKQMAASLTAGGKTSWYTAFASAIEAANAADGAKTITLYQNVDDTVYGKRTAYELTRGPVTLATGGKRVDGVDLIAKGISLTVTGSNGSFYVTVDGKDAELTVNDKDTKLAIVTAKNGGKLSLSNGTFSRVDVMNDGSSASLSGGSYGEITSGTNYVKPYALLAKGYAYKKEDNTWVSNANIGLSKVTVEKAPFAVEKIYPNSDTNYTGNSAFATDGNIKLTAVIAPAPETEGVTYYYWWELFDESKNDWTTEFSNVNTATHNGAESKTLSISNLQENSSYQYRVHVWSDNGYQCDSEPFTVTRHQHSWTYTSSGATITASCTDTTCTSPNGGSVTIAAPAELTYNGSGKPATVTASSDWQGPAVNEDAISYIKTDPYIQQLENGALPTNAGTYTASITVGDATASVTYTIGKATPKAEDFTFSAPTSLTYDGNVKSATVSPADDVIVKYYDKDGKEATPKNAGEYTVKIDVAESTNYAAANGLTADGWKFSITKAAVPKNNPIGTLNITNGTCQTYTYDFNNILPGLPKGNYGTISYGKADISLDSPSEYNYDASTAVSDRGVLTLAKFSAKDGKMTGRIGTVKVNVTTTNYAEFQLTLVLYAVDQIKPEPDGTITASEITYGQTLSESEISGKMKDPDTGKSVNGTFAWTDGTIKPDANDSYKAEWTFTPDAPEYAALTGKTTVKVAPKSIEGATLTLEKDSLEYNAAEQSPKITGVTLEGWSETITYHIVGGDKAINANDAITLTIKGTGNYTGTATAEWKIIPAELTVSVPSIEKEYDGTANATVTPTFNGLQGKDTLTTADYSVTAAFEDAKVGYKKTVIGTVTLKQTDTANNYLLKNNGTFSTGEGTIKKADAPTVQPVELTIYNGVQKDYFVDLPPLPELGESKSYGRVSYSDNHAITLPEGYKAQSTIGSKVGTDTKLLVLRMEQTGSRTGEIGTVTIPVTTTNYQDITLTVNVTAVNQITPVPEDGTITATTITYGNELSASTITGTMQDPNTSDAVNGTFTWVTPAEKLNAGSHDAKWTFTPDKSYGGKYTTNTGTATVTVAPKAVTVSGITAKDKAYDGTTDATLDCSNARFEGVLKNDTLTVTATGTLESAGVGEQQKVKISNFKLGGASAANYVLAESGNQSETTANITAKEVTVTITPNGGTYGSVVAAAAKLSGAVEGDNVPVTLTYTGNDYNSTTVPVNAGSYTVTASIADSNYVLTGKTTANFVIEPKSIKDAKVVLGKGLIANGAEQTQTVEKVLLDGKELPADSYTVAGNTATTPDSHTLTITAKGNYTGTVEQTYVIIPAKAESAPGEEIAIGSGKVKVDVKSEGTVPPATLLTDKAELLAMLVNSGDITADELVQIANGASVDIVLTVKEANVSDEVKTAMAQAAKGYTIGQYLDISLFKYMTVNGSQQAGVPLHTTKDALTISVVVPDALINTNSAVNRTYCIVRNHEGTITVLDAAFDAAGKTLTFKTDRFSIYAIAYKDTAVPSSGSNPGSNNSSNDSETKKNEVAAPTPAPTPASTSKPSTITAMPQTGDTSNPTLYVVLLVASLLGLAVVFVCKKRNDK